VKQIDESHAALGARIMPPILAIPEKKQPPTNETMDPHFRKWGPIYHSFGERPLGLLAAASYETGQSKSDRHH
jgi:hypothetical protein